MQVVILIMIVVEIVLSVWMVDVDVKKQKQLNTILCIHLLHAPMMIVAKLIDV